MKRSDQRAMKKGVIFALIAILVGGVLAMFGATPRISQAVAIDADQISYPPYYTDPPGYKSYTVKNAEVYVPCQKFKPGKSVLASYLDLPLGYGFGEEASLLINEATGTNGNEVGNLVATYTADVSTEFEAGQWQRLNASGETTVNTSNLYWMCLGTGSINLKWYYSDPGEYNNGFLMLKYRNGAPIYQANQDFGFRTFGYNPETPPAPDQGNTSNDGVTGETAVTGETLGTASSDIVKPISLAATYVEASRGVKLTWKASSTTEIDGYKIFRSEQSSQGFLKVGQTAKNTLELLDTNITAGKTYYYQARAYKGENQSYSSNTASVVIPADIVPAKPKNLKVIAYDSSSITVSWDKNSETNIVGYTVAIFNGDQQISKNDADKNTTTHKFDGLAEGTSYKITLVARDDKQKLSPEAVTYQVTAMGKISWFVFNQWTGMLAGLALALLITLIAMIIVRRRYEKRKKNPL